MKECKKLLGLMPFPFFYLPFPPLSIKVRPMKSNWGSEGAL